MMGTKTRPLPEGKYWDIIPPKKREKEFPELADYLKKKQLDGPSVEVVPYKYDEDYCMHKNCPGCKAGTCSGVHMLSCPCRNCSPWMMNNQLPTMFVDARGVNVSTEPSTWKEFIQSRPNFEVK